MTLTANDLTVLNAYQSAGDRVGYYTYLENTGDRYGTLAGDVVQGDSFGGRMANAFVWNSMLEGGILRG